MDHVPYSLHSRPIHKTVIPRSSTRRLHRDQTSGICIVRPAGETRNTAGFRRVPADNDHDNDHHDTYIFRHIYFKIHCLKRPVKLNKLIFLYIELNIILFMSVLLMRLCTYIMLYFSPSFSHHIDVAKTAVFSCRHIKKRPVPPCCSWYRTFLSDLLIFRSPDILFRFL